MLDDTIIKIADKINQKRREELLTFFYKKTIFSDYIKKIKQLDIFKKGSKSKVWRKVAELPIEVDLFFQRVYGKEYFKDKDFFIKKFSEWRVYDE